jgi:hypothetical protein
MTSAMTAPPLDVNPAAEASLHPVPPPVVRPEHAEGELARLIEQQTAKIPSHWFLAGAFVAMGVSAMYEASGRSRASRFVGQWVGPLMIAGLYNKLVKTLGTR